MSVFTAAFSGSLRPVASPAFMANMSAPFVDSFNRVSAEGWGSYLGWGSGPREWLDGPLAQPLKSDRAVGDVNVGDLP